MNGDHAIARFLARTSGALYSTGALVSSQVDQWMEFAHTQCVEGKLESALAFLDQHLRFRTFLVGFDLTLADVAVWAALTSTETAPAGAHAARWFNMLNARQEFKMVAGKIRGLELRASKLATQTKAKTKGDKPAKEGKGGGKKGKDSSSGDGAKKTKSGLSTAECPPLEGAKEGRVVTRFPPEPSG